MITKKAARAVVREQRKCLSQEQLFKSSREICQTICAMECYETAGTIYCYAAVRGEINLSFLIRQGWRDGKKVALPKTLGKEMAFYPIEDFSQLTPGFMGIPEPDGTDLPLVPTKDDILIMPGLAYDRSKNRAGYGGGYYDRYLCACGSCVKLAPAMDFQIFEQLESEAFDMRPDRIILTGGRVF